MGAPDFYFAVNAIFRHIHDRHGKAALIRYWRELGRDYYRGRIQRWRDGGPSEIVADWTRYFAEEPGAVVESQADANSATLHVCVCPAIKHLRESQRDIVPYFCEHCDHVVGAMAHEAGYHFERTGGMGECQQRFVRLTISARDNPEV
jgi:hypothetical protein